VASHLAICAPRIGLMVAEVYLAGLIHDAGRFIMLAAAPATYGAISDKEWRTGDELLAAESEVCGFNHTVLGWLGCRTWNFPDSLAAVNRFHHAWTELDSDAMSKRTKALVRIVGIADDLAFAWDEHQGDGVVVEQILRSAESYLKKVHGRDTSLGTASALDTVLRRAEAASLSS
jgi:HD-like signal output (HDOD) protein